MVRLTGRGSTRALAATVSLACLTAWVASSSAVASAATSAPTLAPSTVPVPTVRGPIRGPGTPTIISTSFPLSKVGYSSAEYFISGSARSYRLRGRAPADGRWKLTDGPPARYRTRLLVYRPSNPKRFNGTVIVEWLNVSAGADDAPDWVGDHTELIRQGFAWVGVSAQALGVNGGTSVLGLGGSGLRRADPGRYATLHHPGDAYSYDIFSQAARAIAHPRGVAPLGGLRPKALIADGESQSAFFLTTYIDAVAPVARVFNGYMVHSRWSGGTSLAGTLSFGVHEPFRTDLDVPVMAFETETDLTMGYIRDRQPDNRWFRDWEVAGTAHADDYIAGVGASDTGAPGAAEAIVTHATALTALGCTTAMNAGPQHWVLDAAIAALNRWVRTGVAPPHAPRLAVVGGTTPVIRRDRLGNAEGGIRTPELDVPIAALSGNAPAGVPLTCKLFGSTTPFSPAALTSLYPAHADYVAKFDQATGRAVRAGFLLPADASQIEAAAAGSTTPETRRNRRAHP
ncbi:MAG TPA: alpha/beta hydrolase domain-containing protein [Acidimicrobiales bacterium]|nr:alpha/beta hydrolase domain-containing protein [Acidimicrobiales bacterium]